MSVSCEQYDTLKHWRVKYRVRTRNIY